MIDGDNGGSGSGSGGAGTSGGGNSSNSNSASALAMSYLSSLPPGATVHLPGVTSAATNAGTTKNSTSIVTGSGSNYKGGYSIQELTGGDAAAESLLSMGAPITSMALPLPNSNGVSVNGGGGDTFTMMSHLHQQHQQEGKHPHGEKRVKLSAKDRKLLDMKQLGYNAEQFLASTTLSDRYALGSNNTSMLAVPQHHHGHGHHHHHSHGHIHTVGATAGATTVTTTSGGRGRGRPPNKKKRGHSSEEDDGEADYEATYQDAIDYPKGNKSSRTASTSNGNNNNKRKSLPSRRTSGGNDSDSDDSDDNSVSSASIVPNNNKSNSKLKRHSGTGAGTSSRNASYRNLSTIVDVLGKSGLSRNSEITHLTEGAEEDLIDLRNPHSRRLYLDFTVLGHTHTDPATNDNVISSGDECLDYVSGVYKGKLNLGRKDLSLHYQLHGSRVLPEALLRLANQRSGDNLNDASTTSSSPQSVSSFIAAQHKDNLPKETRVGKDYQCELPAMLKESVNGATTAMNNANGNHSSQTGLNTRRHTAYSATGSIPVWVPNTLTSECVDGFVALLKDRKQRVPLPVGTVLVVHLPEEKAYRLCCVLEVLSTSASGKDGNDSINPTTTTTMVRVFDGYEDWTVPISQCCTFREGEVELALQLLVKHQGQTTPVSFCFLCHNLAYI